MKFNTILLFTSLVACATQCSAKTSGPPVSDNANLCRDMDPTGHSSSAQSLASPYTITMSSTCYQAGGVVTVTLTASNSKVIGGFLLEARDNVSTSQSYGTFGTGSASGIQTLSCFGGSNNAIGHSELGTVATRTLTWTAPSTTSDLHFRATIVNTRTEYWIGVVSNAITYSSPCSTATTPTPSAAKATTPSTAVVLLLMAILNYVRTILDH